MNVPETRLQGDGGFSLGRSSEILRDEIKFSKFVGRMRKRFSSMFSDMLRTQLILKNIITPEDWEYMNDHIQYDFIYDNHFSELKDAELMESRLNQVSQIEPYVGRYFSQDYVRRTILRQTDEEIAEQDRLIEKEIESGALPDPALQGLDGGMGAAPGAPGAPVAGGADIPQPPTDPEPSETPAGGTI